MTKCPDGLVWDRVTKECRESKRPRRKAMDPCPDGQIRDKVTKECREKKRPGKKAAEPCPDGQIRDKVTKECREKKRPEKKTAATASTVLPPIGDRSCNRVMTLKQHTSTCWFNALVMGIFYSQGMRGVLMHHMSLWHAPKSLPLERFYATVKDLVLRKYVYNIDAKSGEIATLHVDAKAFAAIMPEHIISMLNKIDKGKFMNKGISEKQQGGFGELYLYRLMKILHVGKAAYIDIDGSGTSYKSSMYGTYTNSENRYWFSHQAYHFAVVDSNPDILIIQMDLSMNMSILQRLKHKVVKKDNETYIYNGREYVVDCLYLSNFNYDACKFAHAMAGITCGNKRYMYNGWVPDTHDPGMVSTMPPRSLPCQLMPFDWMEEIDFCIDKNRCGLKHVDKNVYASRLCFNPHKGYRYIIAVKRKFHDLGFKYDAKLASRSSSGKAGKAYNPATNKYVDIGLSYYKLLDHNTLYSPPKR
jgi:hypothetical protein